MRRFVLVLCILCLLAPAAVAGVTITQNANTKTITLAWDPNSEEDLAGYKVYWGRQSGQYDNVPIPTVGPMPNPTYTTPELPNGHWYFAVTAYNLAGLESGFSNEVDAVISNAPNPPGNLRRVLNELVSWLVGPFKR